MQSLLQLSLFIASAFRHSICSASVVFLRRDCSTVLRCQTVSMASRFLLAGKGRTRTVDCNKWNMYMFYSRTRPANRMFRITRQFCFLWVASPREQTFCARVRGIRMSLVTQLRQRICYYSADWRVHNRYSGHVGRKIDKTVHIVMAGVLRPTDIVSVCKESWLLFQHPYYPGKIIIIIIISSTIVE